MQKMIKMYTDKFKPFEIILASNSPRRTQFFREAGIPFSVKTFEVDVAKTHKFGVLDIFVERCVFSKPIFKPESLAYIRIKDNSDRLSEVKFKGWMFASSPALNALENSVYDISILACKKDDKQLEKSTSVSPKDNMSTSN